MWVLFSWVHKEYVTGFVTGAPYAATVVKRRNKEPVNSTVKVTHTVGYETMSVPLVTKGVQVENWYSLDYILETLVCEEKNTTFLYKT